MSSEALSLEQRLARLEPLLEQIGALLAQLVHRSAVAQHPDPGDDVIRGAPALITMRDAAKRLGVSQRTVRRYVVLGFIRTVRIGDGHPRIPRRELARLARGETEDLRSHGRRSPRRS